MTSDEHIEAFTMPDDPDGYGDSDTRTDTKRLIDGTGANAENQPTPDETASDTLNAPANDAGGAGCALDMTNERDRGLIRREAKRNPKRWAGVTEAVKAAVVNGLLKAQSRAEELVSSGPDVAIPAINALSSIGKTFVAIDALEQKEEHRAEDLDRMDSGKPTQAVQLYGVGTPVEDV